VALAVLFKLVARRVIAPDSKVLVISTAHGLKFPDFKLRYHEHRLREFGVEPQHSNRFIDVEPEYEKVRAAVLKALDARQAGKPAEVSQRKADL
jgi:threonine synthase